MTNGKSFRQQVEDNVAVFLLTALATGFAAGWEAYVTILRINDRQTIATDRFDELVKHEQELNALKARPSTSPAKETHTVVSVPEYTRAVDSILNAQPTQDNYQWYGYASDVDELHRLVNRFLDYLEQHPDTTYAQAQTFYTAIEEAASMVTLNAQRHLALEREEAVKEPPPYDLRIPNLNQKIFVGPGWFRIRIEELRQEHRRAPLTHELISGFRDKFNQWRQIVGI
jgi:hypothetical protein